MKIFVVMGSIFFLQLFGCEYIGNFSVAQIKKESLLGNFDLNAKDIKSYLQNSA